MPRPQAADALHVAVSRGLRAVPFITLAVVVDVFVQIVHTTEQHGTGAVCESHAETFRLISLVGAIARLQLCRSAHGIFLFQLHVHCEFLFFFVAAQKFAFGCALVEHLDVLHRIVW